MASNMHFSALARNAMLDTLNTSISTGGLLIFYSGTQPATADTAVSGNTVLAQLALASSPFGAAASGVVTAATITQDSSADATGTATWASFTKSNGTTRVLDVSVGTSGADINMNSVAFVSGAAIQVSSYTITLAA
jgi:hypothetical protein